MVSKILILSLLISSCSFFTKKINRAFVANGIANTADNQNVEKLIKEGKKVIFGKFKITLDNKDITSSCEVGFNGEFDGTGAVLFGSYIGDAVFNFEDEKNFIRIVRCGLGQDHSRFSYFFKKKKFLLNEDISFFGDIELSFSTKKQVDYRKDNVSEPWLEAVLTSYSDFSKEELERRYSTKSKQNVSIIE